MIDLRCVRTLTANSLVVLLLAAAPAAAQTANDTACRSAIASNVTKHVSSTLKVLGKCHQKRSGGKLATSIDCNDLAQADPSNKLQSKRDAMKSAILGACTSAPATLAQYGRCPSPAKTVDDGGATTGIDDFTEVANCMAGLAEGMAERAGPEVFGKPASALSKDLGKCQKALGKGMRKLLATYGKERARCQADRDAAAQGMEYGCEGADPSGKIAKARTKLDSGITKSCAVADTFALSPGNDALNLIGACGDTTEQLQQCIGLTIADRLGSGLAAMAYSLPSDCTAGGIVRSLNSGYGKQLTKTNLSAGWNGIGHSLDFFDGFSELVNVDCDEDCSNCAVSLNPAKQLPGLNNCRCALDSSTACDTINGPDTDDCGIVPGTNTCTCYFGPPLAVNTAGVPACVPISIPTNYSGTADLGTGDWDNIQTVAAVIHLGEELLEPCPTCDGDVTPNDGVRDGTCQNGSRPGLGCDANGDHPTFGAVSIDCLPISAKNISGSGLVLNFELFSADQEMPALLPCDNASESCACKVCSSDTSIGCRSDAECPVGSGTCTSNGGGTGAGVQPNDCDNHECGTTEDQFACTTGPDNKYCDGVTHPSGKGAIACQGVGDCAVYNAGQCTVEERLRCYPDPIPVTGSPGIFGDEVGGLACIGLTTSPAINVASGLPGPVRVAIDFDLDIRCATDPNMTWNPPAGTNCPASAVTLCGDSAPLCNGSCPGTQICAPSGLGACACLSPP
jgi:hypothetical protein